MRSAASASRAIRSGSADALPGSMARGRSALRWIVGLLLALLALAVSGVALLVLWLGRQHGQQWVGRAIAERVEKHIEGHLSFDRVDGPHLDGIRLSGVTLRGRDGRIVGAARSVTARWTLRGLLDHRVEQILGDGVKLN